MTTGLQQTPAWTRGELAGNPHESSDKAAKVQRMFASIARSYDLNNRLHSFGRDAAWRRAAVRMAEVRPGDAVLDVACGTGALTRAFGASAAGRVVGLDFTREMLDVARAAAPAAGGTVEYVEGDAQATPFESASFDVVSIAFGLRNVADPAAALREFARVLRPGGRLVVLEFGTPRFPPIAWANAFYTGWVMPRTATWISGDRSGAYRYLPRSVGTFVDREAMGALMARNGFHEVFWRSLTFGVCFCYRGTAEGAGASR